MPAFRGIHESINNVHNIKITCFIQYYSLISIYTHIYELILYFDNIAMHLNTN